MKVVAQLLDHPKFIRLKKRVGNRAAEFLLRLWGHCETNQKGENWNGADAEYVEIICKYEENLEDFKKQGDLFAALVECGWIEKRRGGMCIHDWNATNSRAVSNWKLGALPKKRNAESNDKPTGSLGLANDKPTGSLGLTNDKPTGSLMNEGMNEGMNEDEPFNLASQVSPPAKRSSKVRYSPMIDDSFIAEMKKIYRPADVDRALARLRAWLQTPKGAGKAESKTRFQTFLVDAEPLSPAAEQAAAKRVEQAAEIPGWREICVGLGYDFPPDYGWQHVASDPVLMAKIRGMDGQI